jgi:hypothetical protein
MRMARAADGPRFVAAGFFVRPCVIEQQGSARLVTSSDPVLSASGNVAPARRGNPVEEPMKFRFFEHALIASIGLMTFATALAQQPSRTQREVDHLLDYVARPDCQFNRNGSWYDGQKARDHLREKYRYLEKRKQVPDAEAFITRAATESSMSGTPYQVRCGGSAPTPSGPWLMEELKRYRGTGAPSQGKK